MILATTLALLVGLVLGMLGGGGSLLMLPVLVYVAGQSPGEGMTTSLLVIGSTSAVALVEHARAGRVDWRLGVWFGVAGMGGAYLGGLVNPLVPSRVLLFGFAIVMITTAVAMLGGRRRAQRARAPRAHRSELPRALSYGAGIGFVAGLLGAGGGFLVVPALVLGGLSVRMAIGTSLLVIAMQSTAGFLAHLRHGSLDLALAGAMTVAAVSGSVLGARLSPRVSQRALRRAFAGLVLLIGCSMMAVEVLPAAGEGGKLSMASWMAPLAGGLVVGGAAALLWLLQGRVSGVSGIAGRLATAGRHDRGWRLSFLLGLLAGGALLAHFAPSLLGPAPVSLGLTVLAGVLVGIGTTLANGCTSGHGVCGVSRLSLRSLAATVTFIAVGVLSVYLVQHVMAS